MLAETAADDCEEGLVVGDEGRRVWDGRRGGAFVETTLLNGLVGVKVSEWFE